MVYNDIYNLLCKIGNLNLFVTKQASIHVREEGKFYIVFVALFQLRVQRLEQGDNTIAQIVNGKRFDVVLETGLGFK